MGKSQQRSKVSFFNANITSIISVALVLLLFGLVAVITIAGDSLTRQIKENIGFTLVLRDSVSTAQTDRLVVELQQSPKVAAVEFISADKALEQWSQEMGEDPMQIAGVNPFSPEIEVSVRAQYANIDSLNAIIAPLRNHPLVEQVSVQKDVVDSVNRNINSVAIVLIIIAAILTIISFALINNTIRLSVYSRRFTIHTMKLVGAKSGFIRRPFVTQSIVNGILAAIIACLLLGVAYYYGTQAISQLPQLVSYPMMGLVFAALLLLGIVICALAAMLATNKYIRLDYDSLFRR